MSGNQNDQRGGETRRGAYAVRTLRAPLESSEPPAPRGGATLTQLESGAVYLIGGANREAQSFGDVFRLDLATNLWSSITPGGEAFPPRSGHSAVAIGERIYVFGGMNAAECVLYEDVMVLDTHRHEWTKPLVEGWMPSARNAHAAIRLQALDGHERVLIYGGSSPEDGAFDDVYVLHIPIEDGEAPLRWEHASCHGTETPEARELHVASLLTPTSVLFSGGRNRDGNVCTDMAVLDVETWHWQLIPICEWNRCAHAAATVNGVIVSFGGFDGGAIRDDCWAYVDDEESWLRVRVCDEGPDKDTTKPETKESNAIPGRFGPCGCAVELPEGSGTPLEKRTQGLLIFGGMNAECDLNDLVLITPVIPVD